MSGKTLKFDDVEINKNKFHGSKQSIVDSINQWTLIEQHYLTDLNTVTTYSNIYADDDVIRPFCIMFPQMSGFIRYLDDIGKNMSFMIKNDRVLIQQYNEIWNTIKRLIGKKFYSETVDDEKYIKTKVKIFNGVVNTTFWGD